MEQKKHLKTILIALLLAGSILGLGYGMLTAIEPSNTPTTSVSNLSETPMVPANFSDLAEKVRSGVVPLETSSGLSPKATLPGVSNSGVSGLGLL
jgi:hypothetical protein